MTPSLRIKETMKHTDKNKGEDKDMKQRPIKFRAWDKEEKKMIWTYDGNDGFRIYPEGEIEKFIHSIDDFMSNKDLILMQFTGLFDKQGKGIYEGDILKEVVGDDVVVAEMTPSFYHHLVEYAINIDWFYEIIGNIYEGLLYNYEKPDIIDEWIKITGKPYPKLLKDTKSVKKPEEKLD